METPCIRCGLHNQRGEFLYGSENVMLCRVEKPDNFLGFVFEGYGSEGEHLKARTGSENAVLDGEIAALKEAEPKLSNREIARRLNTNPMRVGRVLARRVEQGVTGVTGVTPVTPLPDVTLGGDGVPVDFEFDD